MQPDQCDLCSIGVLDESWRIDLGELQTARGVKQSATGLEVSVGPASCGLLLVDDVRAGSQEQLKTKVEDCTECLDERTDPPSLTDLERLSMLNEPAALDAGTAYTFMTLPQDTRQVVFWSRIFLIATPRALYKGRGWSTPSVAGAGEYEWSVWRTLSDTNTYRRLACGEIWHGEEHTQISVVVYFVESSASANTILATLKAWKLSNVSTSGPSFEPLIVHDTSSSTEFPRAVLDLQVQTNSVENSTLYTVHFSQQMITLLSLIHI